MKRGRERTRERERERERYGWIDKMRNTEKLESD